MSGETVYDCAICHTTNKLLFGNKIYNLCKPCKKSNKIKTFLCKFCLEDKPENFGEGRFSTCKKCHNSMKNKSKQEKMMEKKYEEMPSILEYEKLFEKFMYTNRSLFGFTVKEAMDNVIMENIKLSNKIIELEYINKELRNSCCKLESGYNLLSEKINDILGIQSSSIEDI